MPSLPHLPSFLRFLLRTRHVRADGQVGDGREEALLEHVRSVAPPGDVDAAIKAVDEYARTRAWLMNVGDEKGELLDAAVCATQPKTAVEVGAYCGYSGLRIARALPEGAKLYSIEIAARNADVATRLWAHAGVGDRVKALVGTVGDGKTLHRLKNEFGVSALDFVFLDHDKDRYLADLLTLQDDGLLRAGSVVVADNVKLPGAPKYLAHMRAEEGKAGRTVEHKTHVEYQSVLPDLVLESTYLG
jgi:catechol O-methyltransferase